MTDWNIQSFIDAVEKFDAESARDLQQTVDGLEELPTIREDIKYSKRYYGK